jgi:hypothetical protein
MSLRPIELHVLLALIAGPLHGYALVRRIDEDSEGRVRLLPGNLYAVIRRLEAEGLVGESPRNPAPDEDQRRRYYQLRRRDGGCSRARHGTSRTCWSDSAADWSRRLGSRSDNRAPSLAEQGYRLLLRLYPSELRDAYREQMVSVFRDLERDARRSKTRLAWFRFVARAYADVLLTRRRARQFERERLARMLPQKGGSSMATWKHDGTVALRFLKKQPGFTLVAAGTLALGIGEHRDLSVLYGVARPLGLDEPRRSPW